MFFLKKKAGVYIEILGMLWLDLIIYLLPCAFMEMALFLFPLLSVCMVLGETDAVKRALERR